MSLKLVYYGQNDGGVQPNVTLTGDPGTDQPVLSAAGYNGGIIVALGTSSVAGRGTVVVPCDADNTSGVSTYSGVAGSLAAANSGSIPYGTLLNGPGEFSGAIGPSGSKKSPIVRALFQGIVDSQAYDANATFVAGNYIYCGGHVNSNIGFYTDSTHKGSTSAAVGICTHVPTTLEPWLGFASLI